MSRRAPVSGPTVRTSTKARRRPARRPHPPWPALPPRARPSGDRPARRVADVQVAWPARGNHTPTLAHTLDVVPLRCVSSTHARAGALVPWAPLANVELATTPVVVLVGQEHARSLLPPSARRPRSPSPAHPFIVNLVYPQGYPQAERAARHGTDRAPGLDRPISRGRDNRRRPACCRSWYRSTRARYRSRSRSLRGLCLVCPAWPVGLPGRRWHPSTTARTRRHA